MPMAFWNKRHKEPQTFSDLVRGLQYAVNTAQQMLSAHQQMLFNRYFDEQGQPFCREVNVGERSLSVPYLSLVNHRSLGIDEIELSFKARIDATLLKDNNHHAGADNPGTQVDRSCFEMSFSAPEGGTHSHANIMDVRVRFKQLEPSEGLRRVLDEYDKTVRLSEQ